MKASERLRLQDEQIKRLLAEVEALKARLAYLESRQPFVPIPMPAQPPYLPPGVTPFGGVAITHDGTTLSVLGKNFPNAHASPSSMPSPTGRFIQ